MDRNELIAAMQITAAEKPTLVEVTGWGKMYVRSLTVEEFENNAEEPETPEGQSKNRIARGAARVICDEQGNRIFNPDNPDDVKLLSKQPWKLLRQVVGALDEKVKADAEGN